MKPLPDMKEIQQEIIPNANEDLFILLNRLIPCGVFLPRAERSGSQRRYPGPDSAGCCESPICNKPDKPTIRL